MKMPRAFAILGFNLCSAVFIGLSAYGIMVYTSGDAGFESLSLRSAAYAGAAVAACIAGIAYFGIQWDRAKVYDARRAAASAPAPVVNPPRKKKKRRG